MTVTVEEIAAYVELGNTSPGLTFNGISPHETAANKDAKNYDVIFDNLQSNSWCTTFSQTITTVTPGSMNAGSTICGLGGTFDGTLYEIPFIKPVITDPACSTASGEIWTSYIDSPGSNDDYEAKTFTLSVDMEQSKLMIKTVAG